MLTNDSKLVDAKVKTDGLSELVLNVSQGCNLGCSYCFADKGQYGAANKDFMTFSNAKQTIDKFIERFGEIKIIKFFGGEPLLNFVLIKQVCHYFETLKELKRISNMPRFQVVTNLTLLNDDMIQCFIRYNFGVTVSLDGPPEVNDEFRMFDNRTGSFDKVDDNIQKLQRARILVSIESVYNPQHLIAKMSLIDLSKFFADRYDIYNVGIHPLGENDFYKFVLSTFPKNVISQYHETMYDNARDYGTYLMKTGFKGPNFFFYKYLREFFENQHDDRHCSLGVDTLTVNSDGAIYPCYMFTNKDEFKMGDVFTKESFSTKFNIIQTDFIQNRKSDNPLCASCDILKICTSCPGLMHGQYKSINSPIPLACDFYVGLREGLLLGLDEISSDQGNWMQLLNNINLTTTRYNKLIEKICD